MGWYLAMAPTPERAQRVSVASAKHQQADHTHRPHIHSLHVASTLVHANPPTVGDGNKINQVSLPGRTNKLL